MNMEILGLIAERKVREAMDEGAFDNLDGRGQPLNLEADGLEDPATRTAHRLLKNNGISPAWIAEGKEIEQECANLPNHLGNAETLRARVAELNRRIELFNLSVPVKGKQKLPIRFQDLHRTLTKR
jgi:hypothetical protein